MSVLLSIHILPCFSLAYSQYKTLQVGGFRDCQQYGMVFRLGPALQNTKISVHIAGGLRHDLNKLPGANVVRARAGDQDPAWAQHLHSPQIELFVASQRGFQIALALGEGWRIKNDG